MRIVDVQELEVIAADMANATVVPKFVLAITDGQVTDAKYLIVQVTLIAIKKVIKLCHYTIMYLSISELKIIFFILTFFLYLRSL